MIVERLQILDIPEFVRLAEMMHAEGHFSFVPFNARKLEKHVHGMVANGAGRHICLSVKQDGQIIGGYLGFVNDYFFGDGDYLGDKGMYVEPGKRGSMAAVMLQGAIMEWAKEKGVLEVLQGVQNGDDAEKADKFFRHAGYEYLGGNYAKRVM